MLQGLREQWRRLRGRARRDALDRELAEEMAWHRNRLARDLEAQGMNPDDARHAARRRFGNTTKLREEVFDMWQLGSLDQLVQDVRYGVRTLLRSPGFTLVAVLILALGIGATTAIFSAVETLLLRPLPFREPERLMNISLTAPPRYGGPARTDMVWSWPKWVTFKKVQSSYSELALYSDDRMTINTGDGEPERGRGEVISARYLATLGVRPVLGSDLPPEVDAAPKAASVALISHALWGRRFNGDSSVIGKALTIDRTRYTVIGVLPPGFSGMSGTASVWLPILARRDWVFDQAMDHEFFMVGRLREGVTPEQATTAVTVLGRQVDGAHPDDFEGGGMGATAVSLDGTRVDERVRRSVLILLGAVTFVLLIACANIANLFLVRARARHREIAVRLAMGANRGRVVRQLLTESVLLAVVGGAAGVLVAWWGVQSLAALNPSAAFGAQRLGGLGAVSLTGIRLNPAALGFAAAITVITGLLFGIIPALKATGLTLTSALKEGSIQFGQGAARRGGGALVVSEIAMAVVLLIGSGLMIRSLANRLNVNPGFEAERVLTLRLTLADGEVARDSLPGFYDLILDRLGGLPGVTATALSDCPPLAGGCNYTLIEFRDRPPLPKGTQRPLVGVHWASPRWFEAMRIPLVKGRMFTGADRLGAPKVVLVSATAAERFWPGQDPLGRPVGVGQGGFHDTVTVVGVVGDIRFGTLESGPDADVYIPYLQSPRQGMMVYLKTSGDPTAVAAGARAAVKELAPSLPMYDVRPLTDRVAEASAQARFSAVLLGLFAGMALILASLGVYGVISFVVAQRTREIGIRVALGAVRRDVLALIIRQGLVLATVGTAIGVLAALLATRLLGTLLYEVTPGDMGTYVSIVALIVVAALVASWIPARRATRIHPMEALRTE